METQHTFSLIYTRKPGILIRVALVLERRGYTIESMNTSPYDSNPDYWEMMLTIEGDPAKLEQVTRQLAKLIDVFAVQVLKEVYC
ncbi:ACT domain-containing protein [Cytophagaceae bacterium DM2B3-1]|uniref:acetolactate synthase n=1 Tax=Xanthocytophaga flava TaxID=3048013 RepID=A0ABT7CM49_9BACT|nr:ACT domain-containing protein [Xanthocytophaga flavus]MDJ1494824.1 ACT domain-containing protein [Xanthocytophaga flavus]